MPCPLPNKNFCLGILLASLALAGSGCTNLAQEQTCLKQELPPISPPCPTQICRNLVYIFLVDGLNPLELGELRTLRHDLYCIGFSKTYYGQCYHGNWFLAEMKRIHAEEPAARFVVITSGWGNSVLPAFKSQAEKNGLPIDLIIASCNREDRVIQQFSNELGTSQVWEVDNLNTFAAKNQVLLAVSSIAGRIPVEFVQPVPTLPDLEIAPSPKVLPQPSTEKLPAPEPRNPLQPVFQLEEVPQIFNTSFISLQADKNSK